MIPRWTFREGIKALAHSATRLHRLTVKAVTFTRVTACITLVCFLYTSVFSQALHAFVLTRQETRKADKVLDKTIIPLSAGKIYSGRYFGSDKVVITIQDLHCHSEVQRNISRILASLDERFGLKAVYLEGCTGSVDTSWANTINDREVRKSVADTFVDAGKLTGAEYYAILSGKNKLITGLEDEKLYNDNIARLGEILKEKEETAAFIVKLKTDLAPLRERFYTKGNIRLDRLIEQSKNGAVPTEKYYKTLLKLAGKHFLDLYEYTAIQDYLNIVSLEKDLNYKQASREMQRFMVTLKQRLPYTAYRSLVEQTRKGESTEDLYVNLDRITKEYNISPGSDFRELGRLFRYLEQKESLNPIALVKEERKLVRELHDSLSQGPAERDVAFLSDFLGYVEDYLTNKLTAKDLQYYRAKRNEFTRLWPSYVSRDALSTLDRYTALFDPFYDANLRRNVVFLNRIGCQSGPRNSSALIPRIDHIGKTLGSLKEGKEAIVVITGGFHTDGLAELLKEHKITYLVVTPNVTNDTLLSDKVYDQRAKEQAGIATQALALQAYSQKLAGLPVERQYENITEEFVKARLQTLLGQKNKSLKETIKDINTVLIKLNGTIRYEGKYNDNEIFRLSFTRKDETPHGLIIQRQTSTGKISIGSTITAIRSSGKDNDVSGNKSSWRNISHKNELTRILLIAGLAFVPLQLFASLGLIDPSLVALPLGLALLNKGNNTPAPAYEREEIFPSYDESAPYGEKETSVEGSKKDAKTRIYAGHQVISDEGDCFAHEQFGLTPWKEKIAETIAAHGIPVTMESARMPDDHHPERHVAFYSYDFFYAIPNERREKVRAYIDSLNEELAAQQSAGNKDELMRKAIKDNAHLMDFAPAQHNTTEIPASQEKPAAKKGILRTIFAKISEKSAAVESKKRAAPSEESAKTPQKLVRLSLFNDDIETDRPREFEPWMGRYGIFTYNHRYTDRIDNHKLLDFLRSKYGMHDAYLEEEKVIIDHGVNKHRLDCEYDLYLVVPAKDRDAAEIALKAYSREILPAEMRSNLRTLGERSLDRIGNKERGFYMLHQLGLRYPPGIVVPEDIVYSIKFGESFSDPHCDLIEQELGRRGITRYSVRSNPKISIPGILHTSLDLDDSLMSRITEVRAAWFSDRAKRFRDRSGMSDDYDMPIIIQKWVSGVRPEGYRGNRLYASGAFSTHNPDTGKDEIYGSYLENATGDELMTGGKTGNDVRQLEKNHPELFNDLLDAREKLAQKYGPQEVEFVVEEGVLYFLQTRNLSFTPQGEIAYLREQMEQGKIDETKAIPKILALQAKLGKRQLYKLKEGVKLEPLTRGAASTAGAMQGTLVFSAEALRECAEADTPIIFASRKIGEIMDIEHPNLFNYPTVGLITREGDGSSHDAVQTRKAGIPSLIGLMGAKWEDRKIFLEDGTVLSEGDEVVIDGGRNILARADAEVTEPDRMVESASYGINLARYKKEFLKPYLDEQGEIKSWITIKQLSDLDDEAEARFLEIDQRGGDPKAAFLANAEKHFLHELLDRKYAELSHFSGSWLHESMFKSQHIKDISHWYRLNIAWWLETPAALAAGLLAAVLIPQELRILSFIVIPVVAASVFWLPHAVQGNDVLKNRNILKYTLGTGAVGVGLAVFLSASRPFSTLAAFGTLALLTILTAHHRKLNAGIPITAIAKDSLTRTFLIACLAFAPLQLFASLGLIDPSLAALPLGLALFNTKRGNPNLMKKLRPLDIQRKDLADFTDIATIAYRINPGFDAKSLYNRFDQYRRYFKDRYDQSKLTTDGKERKLEISSIDAERLDDQDDDDSWNQRHPGTTVINDDPLALYLSGLGIPWSSVEETPSIVSISYQHYFIGVLKRTIQVPDTYARFVALCAELGKDSIDPILFPPNGKTRPDNREFMVPLKDKSVTIKSIDDDIQTSVRILGEGSLDRMGNKERGFFRLKGLRLNFPSGIVIPEEMMDKITTGLKSSHSYCTQIEKRLRSQGIRKFSIRSNPKVSMPGILHTSLDFDNSLRSRIAEVRAAWFNDRAKRFRARNGMSDDYDMPIIIQQWVSGLRPSWYMGNQLFASGVFSTHNPDTGEDEIYGSYLENATGDELMTGGKTGRDITSIVRDHPALYRQILDARKKLVERYGPQEVEFVVEEGVLYFLQTRNLSFTPQGEIAYLREQMKQGKIDETKAIPKILALQAKLGKRQLYKLKEGVKLEPLTRGAASTAGAMQGTLVFSAEALRECAEADIPIIFASHKIGEIMDIEHPNLFNYPAVGLITREGDGSAHDAVQTRLAGIPSLINLQGAEWETDSIVLKDGSVLREGDEVVIDGTNNILARADGSVTEPDRVAEIASYGINLAELKQDLLKDYLDEHGAIKPELTLEKLRALNEQALWKFNELSRSVVFKKEAFIANAEKHFLHELLLLKQKEIHSGSWLHESMFKSHRLKDISHWYQLNIAWWLETPAALAVGLLASVLIPQELRILSFIVIPVIAASVFWLPHAVQGKNVLLSNSVLALSAGTAFLSIGIAAVYSFPLTFAAFAFTASLIAISGFTMSFWHKAINQGRSIKPRMSRTIPALAAVTLLFGKGSGNKALLDKLSAKLTVALLANDRTAAIDIFRQLSEHTNIKKLIRKYSGCGDAIWDNSDFIYDLIPLLGDRKLSAMRDSMADLKEWGDAHAAPDWEETSTHVSYRDLVNRKTGEYIKYGYENIMELNDKKRKLTDLFRKRYVNTRSNKRDLASWLIVALRENNASAAIDIFRRLSRQTDVGQMLPRYIDYGDAIWTIFDFLMDLIPLLNDDQLSSRRSFVIRQQKWCDEHSTPDWETTQTHVSCDLFNRSTGEFIPNGYSEFNTLRRAKEGLVDLFKERFRSSSIATPLEDIELLAKSVGRETAARMYGEKAIRLSEIRNFAHIPKGYVIKATANDAAIRSFIAAALQPQLAKGTTFSVRSSPPYSMPGLLLTKTNVCTAEDLFSAIKEVRDSLKTGKATGYMKLLGREYTELPVIIQEMVRPDGSENSGSGVAFTRDPLTGEDKLTGRFIRNRQGENVVQRKNIATEPVEAMEERDYNSYTTLRFVRNHIKNFLHYKEGQEIEFVVSGGKLWVLQVRDAVMSPKAEMNIAIEQAEKGIISTRMLIQKFVKPSRKQLQRLKKNAPVTCIAEGTPSSPGAVAGEIIFDPVKAKELCTTPGASYIVVATDKNTDMIQELMVNDLISGIISEYGHVALHESVLATGLGIPVIDNVDIASLKQQVNELTPLIIDGNSGKIYTGNSREALEPDRIITKPGYPMDINRMEKMTRDEYSPIDYGTLIRLHAEMMEMIAEHPRSVGDVILGVNFRAHIVHQIILEKGKAAGKEENIIQSEVYSAYSDTVRSFLHNDRTASWLHESMFTSPALKNIARWYRLNAAWIVETPVALAVSFLVSLLLPQELKVLSFIIIPAVAAAMFWLPHVFRGKNVLTSKTVLRLTFGTMIASLGIAFLNSPLAPAGIAGSLVFFALFTKQHKDINGNPDDEYDLRFGAPRKFIAGTQGFIPVIYCAVCWRLFEHLKTNYHGTDPLSDNYRTAFIQLFKYHGIKRLLDVGCGDGEFLSQFTSLCRDADVELCGMDLESQQPHFLKGNDYVSYTSGDANELNILYKDKRFDIVLCNGVLGRVQLARFGKGSSLDAYLESHDIAEKCVNLLSDNPVAALYTANFSSPLLLCRRVLRNIGINALYWDTEGMNAREETGPGMQRQLLDTYVSRKEANPHTGPSVRTVIERIWGMGSHIAVLAKGNNLNNISSAEKKILEKYTRDFYKAQDDRYLVKSGDYTKNMVNALLNPSCLSIPLRPPAHNWNEMPRLEYMDTIISNFHLFQKDFINKLPVELRRKLFTNKLLINPKMDDLIRTYFKELKPDHRAKDIENRFLGAIDLDKPLYDQGVRIDEVVDFSSSRSLFVGAVVYKVTLVWDGNKIEFFLKGIDNGQTKSLGWEGNSLTLLNKGWSPEKNENYFFRLSNIVGMNSIVSVFRTAKDDPNITGYTLMQVIPADTDTHELVTRDKDKLTMAIKPGYAQYQEKLIEEFAGIAALSDLMNRADRRVFQLERQQYNGNGMFSADALFKSSPSLYLLDNYPIFRWDNDHVITDIRAYGMGEIGFLLALQGDFEKLSDMYWKAYRSAWDNIKSHKDAIITLTGDIYGRNSNEFAFTEKQLQSDPWRLFLDQKSNLIKYRSFRMKKLDTHNKTDVDDWEHFGSHDGSFDQSLINESKEAEKNYSLDNDEILKLEKHAKKFFKRYPAVEPNLTALMLTLTGGTYMSLALLPSKPGYEGAFEFAKYQNEFLNTMAPDIKNKVFSKKLFFWGREKNIREFLAKVRGTGKHADFFKNFNAEVPLFRQNIIIDGIKDHSSGRGVSKGSVVYRVTLKNKETGAIFSFFLKGVGNDRHRALDGNSRYYEEFFYDIAEKLGLPSVKASYYDDLSEPYMTGYTLMENTEARDAEALFKPIIESMGDFRIDPAYAKHRDKIITEFAKAAALSDLIGKSDRKIVHRNRPQYNGNFMVDLDKLSTDEPMLYYIDNLYLFDKESRSAVARTIETAGVGEIGIVTAFTESSDPRKLDEMLTTYRNAYVSEWKRILGQKKGNHTIIEDELIHRFGVVSLEYRQFQKNRALSPDAVFEEQDNALKKFLLRTICREVDSPVLVSDLDGTLTSDSKSTCSPELARRIIDTLKKGHRFVVLTSSRHERVDTKLFTPLIRELKGDKSCLSNLCVFAENGVDLITFDADKDQWVSHREPHYMPEPVKNDINDMVVRHNSTHADKVKLTVRDSMLWISDADDPDHGVICRDFVRTLTAYLEKKDNLEHSEWDHAVAIHLKGCNKGFGIRQLQKKLGVSPGSIIYFGDSFGEKGNDVPLIGKAKAIVNVGEHPDRFPRGATLVEFQGQYDKGTLTALTAISGVLDSRKQPSKPEKPAAHENAAPAVRFSDSRTAAAYLAGLHAEGKSDPATESLAMELHKKEAENFALSGWQYPALNDPQVKEMLAIARSKFTPEGKPNPFAGVTTIYNIVPGAIKSKAEDTIRTVNEWQDRTGRKYISTVRIGSSHMTTYDLIADPELQWNKTAGIWIETPKYAQLNASTRQEIDKAMAELPAATPVTDRRNAVYDIIARRVNNALKGFDAGIEPRFKTTGIALLPSHGSGKGKFTVLMRMMPVEAKDLVALTHLQETIRRATGILNNGPFMGHLALGYLASPFTDEKDFLKLKTFLEAMDKDLRSWGKDPKHYLTLTDIAVSYFKDMDDFPPNRGTVQWTAKTGSHVPPESRYVKVDMMQRYPELYKNLSANGHDTNLVYDRETGHTYYVKHSFAYDYNSPLAKYEYVGYRFGRALKANVCDIVIPSEKDRDLIERQLSLGTDTLWLSRLSMDHTLADPAVIQKDPRKAITRNFVLSVLLMKEDPIRENSDTIKDAPVKMMFDNEGILGPYVNYPFRRFIDRFAKMVFSVFGSEPLKIDRETNDLLKYIDLDELSQAVQDCEDLDVEKLMDSIKEDLPFIHRGIFDKLCQRTLKRQHSIRNDVLDLLDTLCYPEEGKYEVEGKDIISPKPCFTKEALHDALELPGSQVTIARPPVVLPPPLYATIDRDKMHASNEQFFTRKLYSPPVIKIGAPFEKPIVDAFTELITDLRAAAPEGVLYLQKPEDCHITITVNDFPPYDTPAHRFGDFLLTRSYLEKVKRTVAPRIADTIRPFDASLKGELRIGPDGGIILNITDPGMVNTINAIRVAAQPDWHDTGIVHTTIGRLKPGHEKYRDAIIRVLKKHQQKGTFNLKFRVSSLDYAQVREQVQESFNVTRIPLESVAAQKSSRLVSPTAIRKFIAQLSGVLKWNTATPVLPLLIGRSFAVATDTLSPETRLYISAMADRGINALAIVPLAEGQDTDGYLRLSDNKSGVFCSRVLTTDDTGKEIVLNIYAKKLAPRNGSATVLYFADKNDRPVPMTPRTVRDITAWFKSNERVHEVLGLSKDDCAVDALVFYDDRYAEGIESDNRFTGTLLVLDRSRDKDTFISYDNEAVNRRNKLFDIVISKGGDVLRELPRIEAGLKQKQTEQFTKGDPVFSSTIEMAVFPGGLTRIGGPAFIKDLSEYGIDTLVLKDLPETAWKGEDRSRLSDALANVHRAGKKMFFEYRPAGDDRAALDQAGKEILDRLRLKDDSFDGVRVDLSRCADSTSIVDFVHSLQKACARNNPDTIVGIILPENMNISIAERGALFSNRNTKEVQLVLPGVAATARANAWYEMSLDLGNSSYLYEATGEDFTRQLAGLMRDRNADMVGIDFRILEAGIDELGHRGIKELCARLLGERLAFMAGTPEFRHKAGYREAMAIRETALPEASDEMYGLLGESSPDGFFTLLKKVIGDLEHSEWASYLSDMPDKAARYPEKAELYMSQAMGYIEGTLARAELKNYIAENEPLMNAADGEMLGWALVQLKKWGAELPDTKNTSAYDKRYLYSELADTFQGATVSGELRKILANIERLNAAEGTNTNTLNIERAANELKNALYVLAQKDNGPIALVNLIKMIDLYAERDDNFFEKLKKGGEKIIPERFKEIQRAA